jgi:hypothetical protein
LATKLFSTWLLGDILDTAKLKTKDVVEGMEIKQLGKEEKFSASFL